MRKTGIDKKCPICQKSFHAPQWLINRGLGKRCSSKCYGESKKGKAPWNKGIKGMQKGNNGSFVKGKIKWKGTLSEYKSLHYWVGKYLGKPSKCLHCGSKSKGKKMHWANKSGEYKRVLSDWIRLCAKCHYKFDKQYERRQKEQN